MMGRLVALRSTTRFLASVVLLVLVAGHAAAQTAATPAPGGAAVSVAQAPAPRLGPLGEARSWGYQLSGIDPADIAARSPHDVLVLDYSRDGTDGQALTAADLALLKRKPDGGRRIVLAYLSIGEAESYRYYWKWYWRSLWFLPNPFAPAWRGKPNADWAGNYAVRYWDPGWQQIILGAGGYLDRILKAGFDGVWLDKVDSSLEDVADGNPEARAQMAALVAAIAARGRAARPGFLVVPQNGEELLGDAGYRALIDGIGKESLLFGANGDKKPNPSAAVARDAGKLDLLAAERKTVLAVEYLDDPADIADARRQLEARGYLVHFAARELDSLRIGDEPPAGSLPRAARTRAR